MYFLLQITQKVVTLHPENQRRAPSKLDKPYFLSTKRKLFCNQKLKHKSNKGFNIYPKPSIRDINKTLHIY